MLNANDIRNSTNISKVIIITGNKEIPKQDYSETDIIPVVGNMPDEYNYYLKQYKDTMFCFLSEHSTLVDETIVTKAVKLFKKYSYVSLIYSDNYINDKKISAIFYPSFALNSIDDNVINSPFFYKPSTDIYFNEKLSTLYFYDFILKVTKQYMAYHFNEPLFIQYPYYQDLLQDLNIIRES